MIEQWLPIKGFETKYEISSLGRVKSTFTKFGKERFIKPHITKQGYLRISLSKPSQIKGYVIHRIVAKHFISNDNNLPHVNHIDGNKHNNCASNLEWCTPLLNMTHAIKTGLVNNKNENNKRSKSVLQFDLSGIFIKEWPSLMEITRQIGFSHVGISRCCQGRFKTMHGFKWEYKPI